MWELAIFLCTEKVSRSRVQNVYCRKKSANGFLQTQLRAIPGKSVNEGWKPGSFKLKFLGVGTQFCFCSLVVPSIEFKVLDGTPEKSASHPQWHLFLE